MKKLLILLFVISIGNSVDAQRYNLGFGVRAGASNFLGDIGSGDLARNFVFNMELKDTRWDGGLFVRYRFHPMFAVQGSFNYLRIQGYDSNSDNRARLGRNLSFKNDVFELAAKFEVYPQILHISDVGYRGRYRLDFQTYFFAGVGGAYHSPKTEYGGQMVKLRPLMTEGVKYSPVIITMPFGGGFFFTYKRQHRFGFEYQWSWAFTDYLDDISGTYVDHSDPFVASVANRHVPNEAYPDAVNYQPGSIRGDPTDRDNFMLMSVSYSFLIRTRNGFTRSNYSWMYGRRRRWGGTKAKF